MREVFNFTEKEGQLLVSARELHQHLGVGRDFSNWIKNRIEQYDFIENQDFTIIKDSFHQDGRKPQGGRPSIEYAISIDMAKELAMVEGNDKGKEARKYFIEIEKKYRETKSPQVLLAEALKLADKVLQEHSAKLIEQQKQIEVMAPKARYTDEVLTSTSSHTITTIASELGMTAQKLNQLLHANQIQYKTKDGIWVLYATWKGQNFTDTRTHKYLDKDGSTKTTILTTWTEKGRRFIHDLFAPVHTQKLQLAH